MVVVERQKPVASLFLARYNSPLPNYGLRDDYYNAMNLGEETFIKYYKNIFINKK